LIEIGYLTDDTGEILTPARGKTDLIPRQVEIPGLWEIADCTNLIARIRVRRLP
jgi:hypothetical protein